MRLILFLAILNFVGCASHKLPRSVGEAERDGLRYESLNRYDFNRLNSKDLSEKAIAMCHKGEYNEAYSLFKSKLDQEKDNPTYWNHLATCYLLENKNSQAKFYYDLAFSIAKEDKKMKAIIMNNLGLYYLKVNDFHLASEAFEKSSKYYGKYRTPQYNLAQVYLKFSQFEKAQVILTQLYQENSSDIDFIHSLGHLHLMQGHYTKANSYFAQIPKNYLTRDDIATNYAMSLYFSGQPKEAYNVVKNAKMENKHFLFAQTELIKKIEKSHP